MATIEEKKQYLLSIGWKLCIYEPTPENTPLYWNLSLEERTRKRWYVCPVRPPNGFFTGKLRDTEEEALNDLPGIAEKS